MKKLIFISLLLMGGCEHKYDWSKSDLSHYQDFYNDFHIIYERENVIVLQISEIQYDVFYNSQRIDYDVAYDKFGATFTQGRHMIIDSGRFDLKKIKSYFSQ